MSGTSPDSVGYPFIPYGLRTPWGTTTVNVLEWATGNGINDDTQAFTAAISFLPPGGGTLYIPAGTYLISSTLFLPSGTTVMGDGPATVIKAIAGDNWVTNTTGSSEFSLGSFRAIFANENWDAATIEDENFLFANFSADLDTADSVQRKALAHMVSCRNTEFVGITTNGGGGVIAHLHTETSNIHDCQFYDFHSSAADHYSGFKDAWVSNCYFRQTASTSSNPAIQFTGTNNDNTVNTSDGVVCTGNRVLCTGGYLNNVAGISITAAGAGGTVNNAMISGNDVDMDGLGAGGIICYGGGTNWQIINNTVRNVVDYNCILAFGNGLGTPTRVRVAGNRVIDCTRTSGGATLLSVTADGSSVIDNDILGCTATTGAALTDASGYLRGGNTSGSTLTNAFTTSGTVTVDGQFSGSWTPAVNFGGATTGITYSTRTGTFVRQGNLVYLECVIVLTSKGSATGQATITGLPYPDVSGSTPPSRLLPTIVSNTSGLTEEPFIIVSDNTILLRTAVISPSNLTDTNFANNTNFSFCGWYRTG